MDLIVYLLIDLLPLVSSYIVKRRGEERRGGEGEERRGKERWKSRGDER